jgi:prepilin-type N-terminal cleavage/methylation domain-containing protein
VKTADGADVSVGSHHAHPAEAGFTLIEVLVTMFILAVGMFAILPLVDGGNATTADTLRREGSTSLARELVERAQGLPYASLKTSAGAASALKAAVDPAGTRGSLPSVLASGATDWTIAGRNAAPANRMSVHVDACSILAPTSQIRVVDPTVTPCAAAAGSTTTNGQSTSGTPGQCKVSTVNDPTIGIHVVLLVDVSLCTGGFLAEAVCAALGPTSALDPLIGKDGAADVLLSSALGGSFSASICGGKPVAPTTTTSTSADSARKVSVTVGWTRKGHNRSVTQTTVVPEH